jgi:hypothetical protein
LGMNRWGGRREGWRGQEREGETLQHVTTETARGGVGDSVTHIHTHPHTARKAGRVH